MNRKFWIAITLLTVLAFAIPIEHKYDKIFRFFSLTLIPNGLEITKNYDKKIYFYISDLIALFLFFLGLIGFKIPLKRFFGHPLWIVFLCALGSIIASPFATYPIAYTRLLQLFAPIAVFSFVAHAFSEEERKKVIHTLFLTIVIAAVFQSAVGIAQYFHEGPLGLRILGESNRPSTILIQDGSRWLLDRLFHVQTDGLTKIRAAGTLPHANVLGGFLVLSLLFTYALIYRNRKWYFLATLPLQLFALYLTFSRSALIAWAIGTVVWFSLIGVKDRSARFLAAMTALIALLSGALLYQQILDRGGILNYNSVAKGSDSVRLIHQNLSWEIVKNNPLLGLGFSQYSERSHTYLHPHADEYTKSTGPHNIFLFLACETGLISLGSLILFLFLRGRAFLQTTLSVEKASLVACFFAFLFIGCCDFYLILFQQGRWMFFLVMGLLAALENRQSDKVVAYEPIRKL